MTEKILVFCIFYSGLLSFMLAIGQAIEPRRSTGKLITATFLLCVSVWQIYHGFMVSGLLTDYPHLGLIHVPFIYLTGPLLYFYFKFLTRENFKFKRSDLKHFLPVPAVIFLLLPFYMQDAAFKREFLAHHPGQTENLFFLRSYTVLIFAIMSVLLVYMAQFFKNTTLVWNRKYLREKRIAYIAPLIIITTSLIVLVYYAGFILNFIIPLEGPFYIMLIKIISVITFILVFMIYLMGKRYPFYFSEIKQELKNIRYEHSRIQGLDVTGIMERLTHLMKSDKIFCDEDLTLNKLAAELSIAPYQLSEILNEMFKKHFNCFINEYRVTEARHLLDTEPDRSISSIAYAVGFNSQSTFYDWFVKLTGSTPGRYRSR